MSTIFYYQEQIKNYFPEIKDVRIYPSVDSKELMTIYFDKHDGGFDESLVQRIKDRDILPIHIAFDFKPYSQAKIDNVPPSPHVPELIENLALKSTGTKKSFTNVVQKAFPELNPSIEILTAPDRTITINIKISKDLTDDEFKKYTTYAQEIAPIGCRVKLIS